MPNFAQLVEGSFVKTFTTLRNHIFIDGVDTKQLSMYFVRFMELIYMLKLSRGNFEKWRSKGAKTVSILILLEKLFDRRCRELEKWLDTSGMLFV